MKGKQLFLLLCLSVLFVSCGKRGSEEELTPGNALEKYGGVMSKALKKSKAMDDVLYVKNKINTFQIQEGRYPYSLNELVEGRYLEQLPVPPKGMQYYYDPATGALEVK